MTETFKSFTIRLCGLELKKNRETRDKAGWFLLFIIFPSIWKVETGDLELIDMFIQMQEAGEQTKEVILQFQFVWKYIFKKRRKPW